MWGNTMDQELARDVYLQRYQRSSAHVGDQYEGVLGLLCSSSLIPIDVHIIGGEAFKTRFARRAIDELITGVNEIYGAATTARIQFSLRTLQYSEVNEPLPGSDIGVYTSFDPTNYYTVRITPGIKRVLATTLDFGTSEEIVGGKYHAHGVIDIDSAFATPRLLVHEIGHGLIGYGHHRLRKDSKRKGPCVMNGNAFEKPGIGFCREDLHFLKQLCQL